MTTFAGMLKYCIDTERAGGRPFFLCKIYFRRETKGPFVIDTAQLQSEAVLGVKRYVWVDEFHRDDPAYSENRKKYLSNLECDVLAIIGHPLEKRFSLNSGDYDGATRAVRIFEFDPAKDLIKYAAYLTEAGVKLFKDTTL